MVLLDLRQDLRCQPKGMAPQSVAPPNPKVPEENWMNGLSYRGKKAVSRRPY
jgi:hypothetical protein